MRGFLNLFIISLTSVRGERDRRYKSGPSPSRPPFEPLPRHHAEVHLQPEEQPDQDLVMVRPDPIGPHYREMCRPKPLLPKGAAGQPLLPALPARLHPQPDEGHNPRKSKLRRLATEKFLRKMCDQQEAVQAVAAGARIFRRVV